MSIELKDLGQVSTTCPAASANVSKQRSKLWQRIQKRVKRKGVVEVDLDHHRHDMLNSIRSGIRHVLLNHPQLGPKESLKNEDYTHVLEKKVEGPDGKTFVFASHASNVFAAIRRAIGLQHHAYMDSIAPQNLPYLEFVSNSKSGQDFFLSNDQQYLLKTDRKYCIDFFLSILSDYLQHFLKYPHSLIVKYLGLYSIQMPGERKIHFVVMQSIFYPSHRIETRFDIKGALAGRYQEPYPPGNNVVNVLKDKNFVNESIDIGSQRDWFITQLKNDTEFLKELAVQDYSLLIGRQELHTDEQRVSLPNLVARIKKSLPAASSGTSIPEGRSPEHRNNTDANIMTKSQSMQGMLEGLTGDPKGSPAGDPTGDPKCDPIGDPIDCLACDPKGSPAGDPKGSPAGDPKVSPAGDPKAGTAGDTKDDPKPEVYFPLSLTEPCQLDGMLNTENRRLLPNCKNALHIIDGPTHRYFLGIIDFFTLYECRQKVGRIYKNAKYFCADHSTVPPGTYGDRFVEFIADRVK